jgi:hypothetical protein
MVHQLGRVLERCGKRVCLASLPFQNMNAVFQNLTHFMRIATYSSNACAILPVKPEPSLPANVKIKGVVRCRTHFGNSTWLAPQHAHGRRRIVATVSFGCMLLWFISGTSGSTASNNAKTELSVCRSDASDQTLGLVASSIKLALKYLFKVYINYT